MNPENNKRNSRFHLITRHFANKSDRIFLYSAMNTIPNTFFALFKIVIGFLYLSLWFLTFGGYYLALLGIRIYFLRVYHRLRISTESVAD
ncbi:hypothetical protein R53140_OCIKHKEL_00034 [Fructobacillus fructosus]|nr:hypothetical protein R53140_OCIKHKEL_00034 [Fructobacillus fructosus]